MDENTFFKRLSRYAKVGGGLSGAALKGLFGGAPAGIASAMGNLKGPLMKVGQILSMVPDLLPAEYAEELMELQSAAPPMGPFFVKRRMQSELGDEWLQSFKRFEIKPFAAASLGQVHEAESLEGAQLACKLQYPSMDSAVEADMQQVKMLFKIYESWKPGIRTEQVLAEINDRLREELDYENEARNVRNFEAAFKDHENVKVPNMHASLSTKRLLVMDYLAGQSVNNYLDAPQEMRNEIAKQLFTLWYYPLYNYGMLHGDPHMGNYRIYQHQDRIHLHLLDFGCVRYFEPDFVEAVLELYHAIAQQDEARLVAAFEHWGFQNLNKNLVNALSLWARFLFEPLTQDRERLLLEGGREKYKVAGEVHKALREQGGVTPPREFVFLDRAAVGIGSALIKLQAKHNWHRLFHYLIDGFSVERVRENQKSLPPHLP